MKGAVDNLNNKLWWTKAKLHPLLTVCHQRGLDNNVLGRTQLRGKRHTFVEAALNVAVFNYQIPALPCATVDAVVLV